jgi:hypothetical protein
MGVAGQLGDGRDREEYDRGQYCRRMTGDATGKNVTWLA